MRTPEVTRCDLGFDHVLSEEVTCDYCDGLIVVLSSRDGEGAGSSSDSLPVSVQDGRQSVDREPIRLAYRTAKHGQMEVLDFCSLSHALAFLRQRATVDEIPLFRSPADLFQLSGSIRAFSQVPIQEPEDTL